MRTPAAVNLGPARVCSGCARSFFITGAFFTILFSFIGPRWFRFNFLLADLVHGFELKVMPVMEETFVRGQHHCRRGKMNSSTAIAYGAFESKTAAPSIVQPGCTGFDLQRTIWIVFAKIRKLVVDLLQPQRTDIAYWPTDRDFWAAYFKRSGANLKSYLGSSCSA